MIFEGLIALSHLRSRRQDAGVSLIAVLSVVGVTVGVATLIIVLSVMAGFELDLRDKILGANAHLLIAAEEGRVGDPERVVAEAEAVEGVEAAAPFVYAEVMLQARGASTGAILKGIDATRAPKVSRILEDLRVGPMGPLDPADVEARRAVLDSLRAPPPAAAQDVGDEEVLPGLLVGEGLAMQLRVWPGDRVHVIDPVGSTAGPMGVPMPRARAFRVAGVFHTGMYEYDTKWALVSVPDAQDFLGALGQVSGVEARVAERRIYDVAELSRAIAGRLGPGYEVESWQTLNAALFSALALQKWVMALILALIVAVAALGIVTNLVVMVVTRAREIAILVAMGAGAPAIRRVFVLEGMLVGIVGTSLGTVLGLGGCAFLDRYEFPLDSDVYYLDSLPVVVEPSSVIAVVAGALGLCFLATLYPASRAAALDPVEGLRDA